MSIEALDEILRTSPKGGHTKPSVDISRPMSIDEWAWRTLNQHFDNNRLGKKGKPILWEQQTEAHLEHKRKVTV